MNKKAIFFLCFYSASPSRGRINANKKFWESFRCIVPTGTINIEPKHLLIIHYFIGFFFFINFKMDPSLNIHSMNFRSKRKKYSFDSATLSLYYHTLLSRWKRTNRKKYVQNNNKTLWIINSMWLRASVAIFSEKKMEFFSAFDTLGYQKQCYMSNESVLFVLNGESLTVDSTQVSIVVPTSHR